MTLSKTIQDDATENIARLIENNFFRSSFCSRISWNLRWCVFNVSSEKPLQSLQAQKTNSKSCSRAAKAQQICMILIFFPSQNNEWKITLHKLQVFFTVGKIHVGFETCSEKFIEVDSIKQKLSLIHDCLQCAAILVLQHKVVLRALIQLKRIVWKRFTKLLHSFSQFSDEFSSETFSPSFMQNFLQFN